MTFLVKWGRERLHLPLPSPETKLGTIRRSLAEYTHLPEHSFKLIHAGAVMKDDNAPISAYSIRENSTLALVGSGPPPPTSHNPAPIPTPNHRQQNQEPKTEQSTITQIRSEVDKVRETLVPGVDTFLRALGVRAPTTPEEEPTSTPSQLQNQNQEQEHTRLSELLLQSLLRLDAIATDGSWALARAERKDAVREVQGLLDRLDGGWVAGRERGVDKIDGSR